MRIRSASPEDLPRLAYVEREADERFREVGLEALAGGDAMPVEAALRAIGEGRLSVAEVDGEVVGFAYVGRVGGELCLGQISVLPRAGRRGVGTALLLAVIERARGAGERSIVLNTQRDVPWNMPWYARHGFVVVPAEEWTPALRAVTERQREGGLDWSGRVHMRLVLAVV